MTLADFHDFDIEPCAADPNHRYHVHDDEVDPATQFCQRAFRISPYGTEDPEYDTDGERAVACDIGSGEGRCLIDTDEYFWMTQWGFIPMHKSPIQFLLGPRDDGQGFF